MPEGQKFQPPIEQTKPDLKAPKTAEQWCKLYHELTGKNIFSQMKWGNEEESQELLTHEGFHKKAMACQIDLENSELIAEADKRIQE